MQCARVKAPRSCPGCACDDPLDCYPAQHERFSWSASTIACDSLRRAPGRSGMTIATLTISLAAVFTIATFVHSVRGSLLLWVDKMVTADLIVRYLSRGVPIITPDERIRSYPHVQSAW